MGLFKTATNVTTKTFKFAWKASKMGYDAYQKHQSKKKAQRFMTAREQGAFIHPKNDSIVIVDGVNRLNLETSRKNVVVISSTGSGKTSTIVQPSLLSATSKDSSSLVVFDPSGQVYQSCSGYLQKLGFVIKKIDTENIQQTYQFNPLYRMRSTEEIRRLASLFVADVESAQDRYWSRGAMEVLFILLSVLQKTPPSYRHIVNLRFLLESLLYNQEVVLRMLVRIYPGIQHKLSAFFGRESKSYASFISVALTALEAFDNKSLSNLTLQENLHFENLRTEKTAIFLCINEMQLQQYSLFTQLFFDQLFSFLLQNHSTHGQAVSNQPLRDVTLFFDEAGICRIDDLPNILSVSRKKKVSVVLLLQDSGQLIQHYGQHGASTLLNGATATQVYFGGGSLRDAQSLSSQLGVNHKGKPLLNASEIQQMSKEMIICSNQQRPIKTKVIPYYQQKLLVKRAKLTPYQLSFSNPNQATQQTPQFFTPAHLNAFR